MDEQVCVVGGQSFRRPTTANLAAEQAVAAVEAQKDATDATLRQQADAALVDLRTERDRSYTGLSAAAAVALIVPALKLVIRVQIGLIRLLLRKLDGTS